ncbi:MAG TPA: ATP-binding cassette domain-containing protein [Chitinophagaceae bacterium]|nr:ATP-binding cassette domain-containing protein [Chitinophagaceae bacterium]
MKVNLTEIGKRFNYEWVFRQISYEFSSGSSYAILGPNGSGKSTLLQILGGSLSHSEGEVNYSNNNHEIKSDDFFKFCSFSASYFELIEEFTLIEFFEFNNQFKKILLSVNQIIEIIGLNKSSNKQIRYFSSGMKQRVKLAQAFFTEVPVVLLDEPCSNLDSKGIDLYFNLISNYCRDRLLIISSNEKLEYSMCKHHLNVNEFKS